MIFQSSTPLFLHSRRWSLTPAFHLQELLPDEELLVRIKIAVYLLARSFIMLLHELAPIMEVEQFDFLSFSPSLSLCPLPYTSR